MQYEKILRTLIQCKYMGTISKYIIMRNTKCTCYQPFYSTTKFFLKAQSLGRLNSVLFVSPFQNKPLFLCVCSSSLLKTLWQKEKLLVMSNFSFHGVFYPFGEISAIFIELSSADSLSLERVYNSYLRKVKALIHRYYKLVTGGLMYLHHESRQLIT